LVVDLYLQRNALPKEKRKELGDYAWMESQVVV
jgi:hypothetical protein